MAYDYDALGRRVRETRPLETKAFYYDGQRVLAELRPYDGLLLRYFVDGPNYVDEHVVMNEGGASTGDFYYLLGSLYSVIGLTNRDGKVVAMYGYDAYGWVSLRTTGAVIGPASSRLLEITPDAGDDPVALYVSGDPEAYDVSCVAGYVQADGSLGESAVYLTPAEWGTITVSDPGIIPDRTYTVRVAQGSPEEAMFSDAAEAKTWKWGDVANDLGEPVGDGVVGLADILCAMDGFSTPSACTSMDQKPCLQVDGTNDVDDLLVVLDAFGGETYPVSCAAAYPPCYAPAAPPPLPALKHNPYYFTGQRLDHDLRNASGETTLALYHYRARAYDPIHGRFLQRDPAEYVDGMSLYEYVSGRPVSGRDPHGTIFDSDYEPGKPAPAPPTDDCGATHIGVPDGRVTRWINCQTEPHLHRVGLARAVDNGCGDLLKAYNCVRYSIDRGSRPAGGFHRINWDTVMGNRCRLLRIIAQALREGCNGIEIECLCKCEAGVYAKTRGRTWGSWANLRVCPALRSRPDEVPDTILHELTHYGGATDEVGADPVNAYVLAEPGSLIRWLATSCPGVNK